MSLNIYWKIKTTNLAFVHCPLKPRFQYRHFLWCTLTWISSSERDTSANNNRVKTLEIVMAHLHTWLRVLFPILTPGGHHNSCSNFMNCCLLQNYLINQLIATPILNIHSKVSKENKLKWEARLSAPPLQKEKNYWNIENFSPKYMNLLTK